MSLIYKEGPSADVAGRSSKPMTGAYVLFSIDSIDAFPSPSRGREVTVPTRPPSPRAPAPARNAPDFSPIL